MLSIFLFTEMSHQHRMGAELASDMLETGDFKIIVSVALKQNFKVIKAASVVNVKLNLLGLLAPVN